MSITGNAGQNGRLLTTDPSSDLSRWSDKLSELWEIFPRAKLPRDSWEIPFRGVHCLSSLINKWEGTCLSLESLPAAREAQYSCFAFRNALWWQIPC